MEFNQGHGGGVFFRPRDYNGHLILITEAHSEDTRYDDLRQGEVRDVVVDLVDLDADEPELLGGLVLSHKGLTKRIKVGDTMVLGRIGTAPTKKGDAYIFTRFTPEDAQRAEAWVEANKTRPTFKEPRAATVDEKPTRKGGNATADDDPFATT